MFSYGGRKCGTTLCDSWVSRILIPELVHTMKKEDGNRLACGIYARVALAVDVGGSIYSIGSLCMHQSGCN